MSGIFKIEIIFISIIKTYFLSMCNSADDDWEENEYHRAFHLIHLLQANDFYYEKTLWENEIMWKEEWKVKQMDKWKLLHPLRTKKIQERIQKGAIGNTSIEEEALLPMEEGGTTSSPITSIEKGKSKAKPKSSRKDKSKGKSKGKDKGKGKGKGKGKA